MNPLAARYMLTTLLLIAALIGYFAFSQYFSGPAAHEASGQVQPQLQPPVTGQPGQPVEPAQPPPDPSRRYAVWIAVAAILVAAILLTVLVARLQRRRHQAYLKAARDRNTPPPPPR